MPVRRGCTIVIATAALAAVSMSVPAAQAARSPGWRIAYDIHTLNTALDDVAATSAGNAWAAGGTSAGTPVVYRWERGHWRAISRPGLKGESVFGESVAATSDSNAWVALANDPAVDHWNGHRWTRISFAAIQQVLISGIVTTGPADTWVLTENFGTKVETAHHYNGKKWTSKTLPIVVTSGSYANGVSASSAASIWAWGDNLKTSAAETLHYNGRSWRVVGLPKNLVPAGYTVQSEQILALSPTSVWATVEAYYSATSVGPVVLLHWTGHRWYKITGKLPAGMLTGPLASDGSGGLWLVTENAKGVRYFAHYRAGKWSSSKVPAAMAGAIDINSLTLIPGTHSLWAAGIVNLGFGTTSGAVILKYGV
jgi:hypothetical protein